MLLAPPHSDLDSASVDSDMYDLPKKEDALLYQSKGKAELGWGGHPATFIPLPQGPWCQGEPEISIPIILSSPGETVPQAHKWDSQ